VRVGKYIQEFTFNQHLSSIEGQKGEQRVRVFYTERNLHCNFKSKLCSEVIINTKYAFR